MKLKNLVLLCFVWLAVILMITMPVTATLQIVSLTAYGENGVSGFRKSSDYTEIKAIVQNDGTDSEITADQLRFPSGLKFASCTTEVEGIICKYRENVRYVSSTSPIPVTVKLFSDSDVQQATQSISLQVDSQPPTITATISQQADGKIIANVNVADTAYIGSPANLCSGLKRITISDGSEVLKTFLQTDMTTSCSYVNTNLELPITSSGSRTITFLAEDLLGQTTTITRTVNVDRSAPAFFSLKIRRGNNDLSYVRPDVATPVNVSLVFTSNNAVTVDAKFKDFDYSTGEDVEDIGKSCMSSNGKYACVYTNVNLKLDVSKSIYVEYTAKDSSGNSITETKSYEVRVDSTGPQVNYFGPLDNSVKDSTGKPYVGKKTVFVADVSDPESGVDKSSIYADLSSYTDAAGSSNLASNCDDSKCYWNVSAKSGIGSSIPVTLKPLKNNLDMFAASQTVQVVTDVVSPVISTPGCSATDVSGNCVIVKEHTAGRTNYFKQGDYIDVYVNITEAGVGIGNSYLNATLFGVTSLQAGTCAALGTIQQCKWENIGPIGSTVAAGGTAAENKSLELLVYDKVKNELQVKRNLSVYGNPNAPVKFWNDIKIYQGYAKIDRQIMEISKTGTTIPFYLVDSVCTTFTDSTFTCASQDSALSVLDVSFKQAGCKVVSTSSKPNGTDVTQDYAMLFANYAPYMGSPQAMPSPSNDRMRFAKVLLMNQAAAPVDDWIKYNCTLSVTAAKSGLLYTEDAYMLFNLTFIKSPFGTIPENLKYEIANERAFAGHDVMKFVDGITQAVVAAQSVCGYFAKITGLINAFGPIVDALGSNVATKGAATATGDLQQGLTGVLKPIDDIMSGVCGFVNCDCSNASLGDKAFVLGTEKGDDYCQELFKGTEGVCKKNGKFDLCCLSRPQVCIMSNNFLRNWKTLGVDETSGSGWQQFTDELSTSTNPKDSFIYSVITMCVPGILLGVRKMRENSCQYIKCMEQDVPLGRDPSYCRREKAYNDCMFWGGELMYAIWSITPGSKLMDMVSNLIDQFLKNPFGAAAGLILQFACTMPCGFATVGCGACTLIQTGNVLASFAAEVIGFADNGWDKVLESAKNSVWPTSPCDGLFNGTDTTSSTDRNPAGG